MNKSKIKTILIALLLASTANSAWAIEPVDGVYQIGTAQDWAEFCTLHNEGTDQRLNAVLTADITVEGNTMVGINGGGKPFRGTFDGQCHKLTISYDLNEERVAPFRRINGATIKNLIVEGTINTSSKLASGLVGGLWQSGALIQNCVSYVTITDTNGGDATHGGICGSFEDVNGANTIENCAFLGTINAPNREGCGGIVGWTNNNANNNIIRNCLVNANGFNVMRLSNNDIICRNNGNVENCYYIGSLDGYKNDKGAIQATEAQAASGELCFLLNGSQSANPAWFQTLGTDEMPMPFGTDIVYANGSLNCNGSPKDDVTYSNTATEPVKDEHTWNDWGFCAVCDAQQPDFLTEEDGFFLIGTKQDYNWFMVYVNSGHADANAKLTQDLDLSDYAFTSIGNDANRYHGTFDGQNFRIKNMTISGTTKELGFFNVCSNATIKNLILDASCNINSGDCTAALVGCCNGSGTLAIENVGVECNVTGTGPNAAAFVGCNYGSIAIQIKNCYNTGNITAERESAVFSGWFGNNSNAKVENSWNTGKVTGLDGQNSLGRGIGASQFVYTYDLNSDNNGIDATKLADYTAEWLASGQLAYYLNGNKSENVSWYQKIGTDKHPLPFGDTQGVVNVAGNIHNNNGKTGSHFDVNTAEELMALATYVNAGNNTDVDVKLTSDIDMSGKTFAGIGTKEHPFKGEFDGQKHLIRNLTMNISEDAVGFFRYVTSGGTVIKRFTIDSSCSFAGKSGVGAFVGQVEGINGDRDVLFEELGNEATVTASGKNAGAILGVDMSSDGLITVKNCYNTGTIIGTGGESGAFSGWFGDNLKIYNCYNMGSIAVSQGSGLARANTSDNQVTCQNVFVVQNNTGENHVIVGGNYVKTNDDFANGTVFASLFAYNYNGVNGNVWRFVDGDNAHPVLYGNMIALSENSENNLIDDSQYDVTFFRTIKTGGWNTFCAPFAMTAAQITDYFGSGTEVAQLKEGTFTDDMLHFELVQAIEAGKAYLVWPGISADFTEKAIENVTITATEPATGTTQAGYTFQGVFEPTALTANTDFIVAGGNTIVKTSGGNLKGFRAYFKGSSNARATTFVIDDTEATGIITAEGEVVMDAPVYNMQGQRVNGSARGLYITNGKKYVVK